MRIFGDILPFMGWRVIDVDNDGMPTEGKGHFKADAFGVEWLGRGVVLFIGRTWKA